MQALLLKSLLSSNFDNKQPTVAGNKTNKVYEQSYERREKKELRSGKRMNNSKHSYLEDCRGRGCIGPEFNENALIRSPWDCDTYGHGVSALPDLL